MGSTARSVVAARVRRFAAMRLGLLLFAMTLAGGARAAADDWIYVTRPGDTLIGIAARYLADPGGWRSVQARNRVGDPYRLQPGIQLRIPTRLLRGVPVAAEVLMVNGEARRRADSAAAGEVLAAGALLQVGDKVDVTAGSNLSLRFPDGSRLLVLENSRFTLAQAVRLAGSDTHRVRIDLAAGRIESIVTPAATGGRRFEIRTLPLRMAVRGTHFRIAGDGDNGPARGEVLAGIIRASNARAALDLAAGFGAYVTADTASPSARPLLPAPDTVGLPDRVERLPLRFAWTAAAGARGYRAQVLDAAGNLRLDGMFDAPLARWADLPDGRYTLRVRSVGEDRLEGRDAEHAFALKARPEPPFVVGPERKVYGAEAEFAWSGVTGIGVYHLQLAHDAAFTTPLLDLPNLTTNRITRPLAPGRYFWRIASVGAGGDQGPFSDAIEFEQRAVPLAPAAAAPEIDDETLRLRWRAGEPGQRYLLQVARAADFGEVLLERTTDQAAIAVPRPASGEYYMRVRAIDADGFAGPFGTPQRISVPGGTPWWWLLLLLPLAL